MDDNLLEELEDCWKDLVPSGPTRDLFSAPERWVADSQIQRWVSDLIEEDSSSILAVPYSATTTRERIFRQAFQIDDTYVAGLTSSARDWIDDGVYAAFEARLARICGNSRPWAWIADMVGGPVFVAEEPLRSMIDENTSMVTGVFHILWDLRFKLLEHRDTHGLESAFTRWLANKASEKDLLVLAKSGVARPLASPQEQAEMMLFLVSLARQNGLVDRVVFQFDGIDQAVRFSQQKRRTLLKPLTDLCMQIERWGKLRSGVGLMLGYATNQDGVLASLKQFAPFLHKKVQLALV